MNQAADEQGKTETSGGLAASVVAASSVPAVDVLDGIRSDVSGGHSLQFCSSSLF
ncbi:MAG UNVERIFIED_CONTAM: hypothetical protein LVR18_09185 [Planctomycetaceae bacterium]